MRVLRKAPSGGAHGPQIAISALASQPEGVAAGTLIGNMSVIGGTGTYTFTEDTDASNKFANDGTHGVALRTSGAWANVSGTQSYAARYKADNGVDPPLYRTFTVPVLAVLAAPGLDDYNFTTGVPKTVNITGAHDATETFAFSTPLALAVLGFTLNSAARTVTYDGSGSASSIGFSLIGTHAQATNSPRTTPGLTLTVADAPVETYVALLTHGDSRVVGVFAREAVDDTDKTDIAQYVREDPGTPGAVLGGYSLPLGLTGNINPIQQAIGFNGTSYLSPMEYAARRLRDDGGFKVDISGGGWNGAKVAGSGHILGPLPDLVTSANVDKGGLMYAARGAASPGATILPLIVTVDTTNDGGTDPSVLLAAKLQQLVDLRTASGYSTAPIVVVSVTPEHEAVGGAGGALVEQANRVAALKTTNAFYCALPSGLGSLHEGEVGGGDIQLVRDAGYLYYGRSMLIALGELAGTNPNFTITDNVDVAAGGTTEVTLGCDQPVYFTVHAGSTGLVELSGDVELAHQVLRPAGGAWPAYDAGTPANNTRAYTLDYKTGDGITGSITRHVVVNAGAVAPPDPLAIWGADLVGWYEAADLADGAVSSWPEKGGNGIAAALAQATSGSRPVRSATSFNGLPGVTGDGVDDILTTALTGVSSGTPVTVFIAVQLANGGGTRVISLNKAASNDYDGPGYIPIYRSNTGKLGAYLGGAFTLDEVDIPNDEPHVVSSVPNLDSNPTHQMYKDGVTNTPVALVYPAFAPTVLTVFGSETPADFAACTIATIAVVKNNPTSAKVAATLDWINFQNNL